MKGITAQTAAGCRQARSDNDPHSRPHIGPSPLEGLSGVSAQPRHIIEDLGEITNNKGSLVLPI